MVPFLDRSSTRQLESHEHRTPGPTRKCENLNILVDYLLWYGVCHGEEETKLGYANQDAH